MPRGLLFWFVLIILLFCIAIAPVQTARTVLGIIHATGKFFAGLKAFLDTLASP